MVETNGHWDQPIRDVLPDFRLMDEYATQHANLRDLLSHRTGLPRHDFTWYGQSISDGELVKGLRHLKPNVGFRELWQYNNLMYETVGYLCKEITGAESWSHFIQESVIDPLGLKNTTANFDPNCTDYKDVAEPYILHHSAESAVKTPRYIHKEGMAAGSIQSTLSDLVQWLSLHNNQGVYNGQPFISPYNLKQMHKPQTLIPATVLQEQMFNNGLFAYGMGWFVEPYKGVNLIHHGGNLDGFSVIGAVVPQEQLSIAILTNINAKSLRGALLYEAVDRALGLESSDWSQVFLARNSENVAAERKAKETASQNRKTDRAPSDTLAAYAGSYSAPAYADFDIKMQDDQLQALYMGEWWPLEHHHHDVFTLNMARLDESLKLSFGLDLHGHITQVTLPIEPAIGGLMFKRKPEPVAPVLQEQLVGCYS
jgi:CubicO group peptidase (beta-lactamase class C family)